MFMPFFFASGVAEPVLNGELVDQAWIEGTGVKNYDASVGFIGTDITYTINLVTGVTIHATTGVISFNTGTMNLEEPETISVTATNPGGSAVSDLDVIVSPPIVSADTVPVMGALSDTATLVSETGTDGVYSSDFPGETFVHGVDGATIVVSYEIFVAAVWSATTANAVLADTLRKKTVVTGSDGTVGTFLSAHIIVSAALTLTLDTFTLTDGGSGVAAIGAAEITYTGGEDPLRLHIAPANTATPATKPQILAGTGGGILGTNAFDLIIGAAATIDLSAYGVGVDGATHAQCFIEEIIGSAESGIVVDAFTSPVIATEPALSSSDPADGSTDHPVGDNLVLTMSENVFAGTDVVTLREDSGGFSDKETFNVVTDAGTGEGQVSFASAVVTLNPTGNLAPSTAHATRVASTAITGAWGFPYVGIANDTTLNFSTSSTVPGPTFQGSTSSTDLTMSFTSSGLTIGSAGASRWVIVAFSNHQNNLVTEVRIGGILATEQGTTVGSGGSAYIYAANVPDGTTADLVVTSSANSGEWGIHWWTASSPTFGSAIKYQNNATPHSTDLNVTSPNSVLGISMAETSGGYTASDTSVVGLTITSEQIVSGRGSVAAQADAVATATPRSIDWTNISATLSKFRSVVVEVS